MLRCYLSFNLCFASLTKDISQINKKRKHSSEKKNKLKQIGRQFFEKKKSLTILFLTEGNIILG